MAGSVAAPRSPHHPRGQRETLLRVLSARPAAGNEEVTVGPRGSLAIAPRLPRQPARKAEGSQASISARTGANGLTQD